MARAPTTADHEIAILPIREGRVTLGLIGQSPLIFNAVSEKARRELLLPRGRKTRADRATALKHDPPAEFRNSTYRTDNPAAPTRLIFPAPAIKGAMSTAALDMPGTRRTEIGRLVWAQGAYVPVYGIPQIFMSVVRSADIARTPDIRTRAILPAWGMIVSISFVQPKLSVDAITNLLAAAGIVSGLGDFRQEKGAGSYGQFAVVQPDDPALLAVMRDGGREAQDAALADPVAYDVETEQMLAWYVSEVTKLRTAPAEEAAPATAPPPTKRQRPHHPTVRRGGNGEIA